MANLHHQLLVNSYFGPIAPAMKKAILYIVGEDLQAVDRIKELIECCMSIHELIFFSPLYVIVKLASHNSILDC